MSHETVSNLEEFLFLHQKDLAGEKMHDPRIFFMQRLFWDHILAEKNSPLFDRIKLLLPKTAVEDETHAKLYETYGCEGFALYALGAQFVSEVSVAYFADQIILQPQPNIPWKYDFQYKSALEENGFSLSDEPSSTIPTLVIFTFADKALDYEKPRHLAIYIGQINGHHYFAHKRRIEYLPNIAPLESIMEALKGAPDNLNLYPEVEYWEYHG